MTSRPAKFDPSIDPTADQVRALRDAGRDGPVVMLNRLKFREQASYPAGSPHPPYSGAEAYRRYQTAFVETVGDVSHAEVVWERKIDRTFIGDAGYDWDKCLLVRYPSRQHFLAMMADAAYREALVHRYAGLEHPPFADGGLTTPPSQESSVLRRFRDQRPSFYLGGCCRPIPLKN